MPRKRRRIISNQAYEICFRAREGLPLVCYQYMKLILGSILARTQRDDKLIICHDIWNGSHPHIIAVAKDADDFTNFYGEVQKKITEAIKKLLGLDHLNIWEGNPTVIKIHGINEGIERISYLYANPAQDNLVDNIRAFPGYSSYRDFINSEDKLGALSVKKYPWIRLPSIKKLRSRVLSRSQDRRLARRLKNKNRARHKLIREPNAWMRCFGVEDNKEVKEINAKILDKLDTLEQIARELRIEEGKPLLGVEALRAQELMKPHKPKKKTNKIFVYANCSEARKEEISSFKKFCDKCRECYLEWKRGNFLVEWPPGAFKPPLPPSYNLLAY